MKIKVSFLLLIVFNLMGFSQNYSGSNDFKIPESDYFQSKKIDELEIENKSLKVELEQLKNLSIVLGRISDTIKNIEQSIKNSNAVKDKEIIFKNKNLYDILHYNEFDLNIDTRTNSYKFLENISNEIITLDNFARTNTNETAENYNNRFLSFKVSVNNAIDKIIPEKNKEIENKIKENNSIITKIIEFKESEKSIDKLAIMWGLPAFCITILLLNLTPQYLRRRRDESIDKVDRSSLDVSTVLLLTMTILILGLSKMINGEVLGTLLGGISAYVLNRNSGFTENKTNLGSRKEDLE